MKISGIYAASNFFVQQGLELDTDKKCYHKSNKIVRLFTISESCKSLPKLDYILMFRTLYAKCEECSIEDFENSSVVQLSFVYNRNRKLIIHESKNFEEVKMMAEQLAKELNLRIKDTASDRRNSKWIN